VRLKVLTKYSIRRFVQREDFFLKQAKESECKGGFFDYFFKKNTWLSLFSDNNCDGSNYYRREQNNECPKKEDGTIVIKKIVHAVYGIKG
jgi:hypothetical protein